MLHLNLQAKRMSDYHEPVLLSESIDALVGDEEGCYVDVTYGGGGHTAEILNRLGAKGRLMVFDQDEEALGNLIEDDRLVFVKSNFRHLYRYWRWLGWARVDGVLADLGVSSHQLDADYRGFSHRFDAGVDMRMNTDSPLTARHLIKRYDFENLVRVFSDYGEVRNAKKLARTIVEARESGEEIRTTADLNVLLDEVRVGERNKYLSQVYQALRIEVNEEMQSLEEMLMGAKRVLKDGGRIVVVSYHSLEDRMVKRFFRSGDVSGEIERDVYGRSLADMKQIGKLIQPGETELNADSRSRSAKMRIGEKLKTQ